MWGAPAIWDSSGQRLTIIPCPIHVKWETVNLHLLGLGKIRSGKIAVERDLIYDDNEKSWDVLCPDGNSSLKERKRLLTA